MRIHSPMYSLNRRFDTGIFVSGGSPVFGTCNVPMVKTIHGRYALVSNGLV